ncbi:MAG: hypothetical protein CSB47_03155 [Proteobacteria bacterium]|nr:MAG: hypothetical protein CSB47_03155 [Pseudomonadota bacterium]
METVTYTSIFLLGILGTGHCVGMCGPLVLAFPGREKRLAPHLCYHFGRMNTYVFFGALLGGLSQLLHAGGEKFLSVTIYIQLAMTVFSSLFLLWFGLSKLGMIPSPNWMQNANPNLIPGFKFFQREFADLRGNVSYYLLGILFGFLPCGLSYAAFAVALSSGNLISGGTLAFIFALGTIPGLLVVGYTASKLFESYRNLSDLIAGLVMIGMAVFQILNVLQAFF